MLEGPEKEHKRTSERREPLLNRDMKGEPRAKDERHQMAERVTKPKRQKKGKLKDPSKRRTLKWGAAATGEAFTGAAVGLTGSVVSGFWKDAEEGDPGRENSAERTEDTEANIEKDPTGKDVLEQLREFGEVVDMGEAVEVMRSEQFAEFTETADGRARLEAIAERLKRYDFDALAQPFQERELDPLLAAALPGHESDMLSRTSPRGAIGTHQFMPRTIKALGYTEEDALDPYKASEMSAEYLKQERSRFGDDVYMLLHAYNAGASLNGFTNKQEDSEKWDREHLYAYVAERFNRTYTQLKEEGFAFSSEPAYGEHIVESGETLWGISKKYGIDLEQICKENGIADPDVLEAGITLRIPYKNELEKELRQRNANTLQMLEYAPHLMAMRDAMVALGYIDSRNSKVAYSK